MEDPRPRHQPDRRRPSWSARCAGPPGSPGWAWTRPRSSASLLDHLLYSCARELREATPADLYQALAHAVRDRLVHRWLATQRTYEERDVKRVYYLSSEFLTGRSLGLCLLNLGLYETRRGAGRRARLRPRTGPRPGGRPRPGQRRPGPAGRLLHGLAGHAGAARGRLRHPLRLRHLRAAHRGRPPGRAARQLAAERQPLGAAAPGGRADRAPGRPHRDPPRPRRPAARRLGAGAHHPGRALRLVHRRPQDRHREHAAAVGGARHPRLRPAVLQRGRLPARGRGEDRLREHLQGPLPERPDRGGQGAAPQAAVLLRRLLGRGHRAPVQEAPTATSTCSPSASPSSSTTPTRPSPSPS